MLPNEPLGFVILCPNRSIGGLRNSVGSIKHHAYNREHIAVTGGDATKEEIEEMRQVCPTGKGRANIMSLINTGMSLLKSKWAFLFICGKRIPRFLERKLALFAKDPKDILFPVLDNQYNFCDSAFNGILINKETFMSVGFFAENKMEKEGLDEFDMSKLFWAHDAVKQGCRFKGIVGMRII